MSGLKPGLAPGESLCRGCGAIIIWAKTPAGKNAPVDAQPEKRWVEQRTPGFPLSTGALIDTYMPHHATCSGVEQFRKPKGEDNAVE